LRDTRGSETQSSLSSFHTAGQQKVNLLVGVPRFQEIVNVTRNIKTPSMEIWLNHPPERLADLTFVRSRVHAILKYREVNDMILDYEIKEGREPRAQDGPWYALHEAFVGTDYKACDWSVRLVFDVNALYAERLALSTVAEAIHSNYADAFCVVSPDNVGVIDVYIRTDNLGDVEDVVESVKATRRKGKKKREPEDDADLAFLITDENKEHYFLRDLVLPSLRYLSVGGIENLKRCYFQEKAGQWFVTTDGSNLRAVIAHPEVNPYLTVTNHLWDTYECLGIEATRMFLRRELDKLISVSHRHTDLLINAMTYSGRPTAASSRGIDIQQVGLLAKIGFEQPWDHFFQAALVAERDDMRGASSAIIVGRVPCLGGGQPSLINAETELQIDEDREAYNAAQTMSSRNPAQITRIPRLMPRPEAIQEEARLVSRGRPVKKSAMNAYVEPAPFVPDLPSRGLSRQTPSLVTRLVIRPKPALDPTSRSELGRLAPVPSTVFARSDGGVREHEEEHEVF
jgi:DNA-directed RNA polymerase II subunit RPB1